MSALSAAVVGRTAVVVGYLGALAIAGSPGPLAAVLAVALVLVWAAPLVTGHARHRPASRPAAPPGPR